MYYWIYNWQAESIHNLGEEIGTKLAKAEGLGAEGLVDESMQLMNDVEDLKKNKVSAEVSRSSEFKDSQPFLFLKDAWIKEIF